MMGGISARTALTIIGERHDLQVMRLFYGTLPGAVRKRLACRIVEELERIEQAHAIEGLVMGEI